ncbi:hypothetical protein BBAD15_g4408 [Beauveria bassiana D1-5]|uniref:Uncharacterized protein n=1 Tax=Beauveria bassiana D1-5 TaxID=1245745 RepID=A0A0A2VV77_BEABA|nr:hypothetical protein BBAD15_g4408 [Beauveria bassiana D1-5]
MHNADAQAWPSIRWHGRRAQRARKNKLYDKYLAWLWVICMKHILNKIDSAFKVPDCRLLRISVGVNDATSRQRVLQPELDSSRRDEESYSGAPRYADGAGVADAGENAEVGEFGLGDRLQAQNISRSANTRLGTNQQDMGECQVDEIADSDAESDHKSASYAIRQHDVARQGSTKRKHSATKQDMASGLQKRRQTSGFIGSQF